MRPRKMSAEQGLFIHSSIQMHQVMQYAPIGWSEKIASASKLHQGAFPSTQSDSYPSQRIVVYRVPALKIRESLQHTRKLRSDGSTRFGLPIHGDVFPSTQSDSYPSQRIIVYRVPAPQRFANLSNMRGSSVRMS